MISSNPLIPGEHFVIFACGRFIHGHVLSMSESDGRRELLRLWWRTRGLPAVPYWTGTSIVRPLSLAFPPAPPRSP